MTTDTDVRYETKAVRAIRGMEARTIEKWEGDGWELVAQRPGKVQTEITFRRPKPKSRRLLWIIGGGVFVVVLATIITFGVIGERDAAPANPAPSETAAAPGEQPSAEPSDTAPTPTPDQDEVVLTPDSSPELAALLVVTDYCAPDVAASRRLTVARRSRSRATLAPLDPMRARLPDMTSSSALATSAKPQRSGPRSSSGT